MTTEHVSVSKIRRGFATATHEDRVAYLSDLRENWQRAESAFGRRLFLGLVVVAVGSLLLVDDVGQVTVLGVTLSELTTVRYLVPVILAYLAVETATTVATIDLYGEAHAELFKMTFPEQHGQHLGDLLTPANAILWSSPGLSWFESHGRIAGYSNGMGIFWLVRAMAGLVLSPVLVGAYVVGLLADGVDVGGVISTVASLALLTVAAVQTVAWVRGRMQEV
ncbi:hypothetical protein [Phycicoccus sonneratiae]|uniref:Uncharacterized protein n=1 Tax=Phycicoccus sonneratiae TaxID=2807628 RepID=A0ABS2CKU2_9MICO|nr:hypothetical protein [Phycicoccus sonneraticus]MBM6399684.1 hypothetical protein [Phycicoccus sonneraticus]